MDEDHRWPELPRVGTRFEFTGGYVYLRHCILEVTHAEHRRNAVGRPGGRVWFRDERGQESSVTASYFRENATVLAE